MDREVRYGAICLEPRPGGSYFTLSWLESHDQGTSWQKQVHTLTADEVTAAQSPDAPGLFAELFRISREITGSPL